jgi:hypothetical protein
MEEIIITGMDVATVGMEIIIIITTETTGMVVVGMEGDTMRQSAGV